MIRSMMWMAGLLLAFSGAVRAEVPVPALDLDEAVRLALRAQPQLEAQNAQIAAARELAVAASQLPDPRLRFGVASLPVDSFDFEQEPMTQAVLGLTQVFPGGDKRRLAGERAGRETDQRAQGLEATRRRIARDVRLAWLDAYLPEASLPLLARIETEFQRQVEWSEVAYKTGKQSQDETFALRGMRELVRDRADELKRQAKRARAGLARWLGERGARPLATLKPEAERLPEAELAARLERHPELAMARAAVAVADAEADQARAAYKPDWSVDLAYGLRGGDRPDFLSLVVGVDLPLFPEQRQDRRLAARLSGVESARQQLDDRLRALRADLDAVLADWRAAGERLARFDSEILPLAGRRVDSALNAYGADKAGFGRVQEARRAELEARLTRLNLRVALARARVNIDYLTEEVSP